MRHAKIIIKTFLALQLLLPACQSKPGDPCSGDEAQCLDDKTLLSCVSGKWLASPCKGIKGCKIASREVSCDISDNVAGDPCPTNGEGQCGSDGKSLVTCVDGKYEVRPCRGKDGCVVAGTQSTCDPSISEVGETCTEPTGKACSVDKKNLLACNGGKWEIETPCGGEKNCDAGGDKIECHIGTNAAGYPCSTEGGVCDPSGKSWVVCVEGKYQVQQCRGQLGCKSENGTSTCDKSIAEVGELCTTKGGSCSVDKKNLLVCTDGKFVLDRSCGADGCDASGDEIICESP